MKKQKFLTILFCVAILLGAFSTAHAQGETGVTGSTYRLFVYSAAGVNLNADATFQENGVFLLSVGSGSGSYFAFDPVFLATYSALGIDLGSGAVDASAYMAGAVFGDKLSMLGIGIFLIKGSGDPISFYFSGTRL